MKKINSILWGIIFVAAGVLLALNAFDILSFELFFDGWWTLFIIVPCTVSLFTERDKLGSLIGIAVGVILLLWRQEILDISMIWKLLLPIAIILIGVRLIFGSIFDKKAASAMAKIQSPNRKIGNAIFCGCDMNCNGESFEGAEITAVFGGATCDLRGAYFPGDCAITATAVFGGIDILVPPHVTVKVDSTSIFGGVENKAMTTGGSVTLYIKATCIFGGLDVK